MINPYKKYNEWANNIESGVGKFIARWSLWVMFLGTTLPTIYYTVIKPTWVWGETVIGAVELIETQKLRDFVQDSVVIELRKEIIQKDSITLVFRSYHNFMFMRISTMLKAETDPVTYYGIPLRSTNPPEGYTEGDLNYFTHVPILNRVYPIIYGGFPSKTDKKIGILDMYGKYDYAGHEIEEIRRIQKLNR